MRVVRINIEEAKDLSAKTKVTQKQAFSKQEKGDRGAVDEDAD